MLTSPTLDKLNQLRLKGMARALLEQREGPDYHSLDFEDRLGLLVDREIQDKENRRLARYLSTAKLRASACIEDIDFTHPRGLDRSQVLHLAACHWVNSHQPILITGPTGAGYLAKPESASGRSSVHSSGRSRQRPGRSSIPLANL